jgi:hypothetical protein
MVPEANMNVVLDSMLKAGAGKIGNYTNCATYYETRGQFTPSSSSNPTLGRTGNLESLKEIKLELFCDQSNVDRVIKAMHSTHPYETPSYQVVPLRQKSFNYSLGCYGSLAFDMSLDEFGYYVKDKLAVPDVRLWLGNKQESDKIRRVSVCGGTGFSVLQEAMQLSDVFVSSDFSYHQYLQSSMPLIDAGHYYTERVILDRISEILSVFDVDIEVLPTSEHDINKLKTLK